MKKVDEKYKFVYPVPNIDDSNMTYCKIIVANTYDFCVCYQKDKFVYVNEILDSFEKTGILTPTMRKLFNIEVYNVTDDINYIKSQKDTAIILE